ncbi:MAG: FtsX-like permease family protein, partial [Gemmatimonadota bacterium]|nr:FtsX-like permease family protein [Gemmatimonadota bacterium]
EAEFIILIASINIMNLSTARSTQRAREIGIRKVAGAHKTILIGQFMGESLMMTMFAAILALVMVILVLPSFSDLINQTLTTDLFSIEILLIFFGIAIVTGLLAGSYPAFFLSNFNPVVVLHGTFTPGSGSSQLRRVLVVFQFGLSILLIIGTLTVYEQIAYMRNKDLGIDRDNLVYIRLEGAAKRQYETFRRELLQQPGIVGVTSTAHNPLRVTSTGTNAMWAGRDPSSEHIFHRLQANYDVVNTLQMELVHGREFSRDFPGDLRSFIVNEEMARAMGMENPVGTLLRFGREGPIIGVVKNFHFQSLYTAIEPLIILLSPARTEYLFVRIAAGQTAETIAGIERVFKKFNDRPFEFSFQDEQFERMYRNESTMGTLATFFAIFAIFISCLGLFGLASYTAEQRTKEIGIRKILGASIPNLVILLSKEFIRLVVVSFALAAPLAYHFMTEWLNDFAYHTSLGWRVFVFAGVLSLIIACITVSYQAIKVAMANPVESLRYE